MLKQIYKQISDQVMKKRQAERDAMLYRNLIRHEAKIGGKLFGSVPKGGRREFFCLDEHTWVWHEEYFDNQGKRQITTTRYDVRPNGVLKSQNGAHYQPISEQELKHLYQATQEYNRRVQNEMYSYLHA